MTSTTIKPLRVGYVPEHFSTPLLLSPTLYTIPVTFHPYPSGTGHMIQSLRTHDLDIAIGLTEAFISGIKGPTNAYWYKIIGQYVSSPLCWAISTGAQRQLEGVEDLNKVKEVDGAAGRCKIGISRVGSGSQIMSYVLAGQEGWLTTSDEGKKEEPFEFVVLDNFKNLRDAVNSGVADAFMWEHFTSKKFYDSGEIKRIGEIFTPWPSWVITAHSSLLPPNSHDNEPDPRISSFLDAVNQGISYFNANKEEAIQYIAANLDYSEEDAREWIKGVRFVSDVRKVQDGMVEKVMQTLKEAGVVEEGVDASGVVVAV